MVDGGGGDGGGRGERDVISGLLHMTHSGIQSKRVAATQGGKALLPVATAEGKQDNPNHRSQFPASACIW